MDKLINPCGLQMPGLIPLTLVLLNGYDPLIFNGEKQTHSDVTIQILDRRNICSPSSVFKRLCIYRVFSFGQHLEKINGGIIYHLLVFHTVGFHDRTYWESSCAF